MSSAIPYLIPENMTLEQLHAKVRDCEVWECEGWECEGWECEGWEWGG